MATRSVVGPAAPPAGGPAAGPDRRLRLARLGTLAAIAAAPLTSLLLPGIGLWQDPSAVRTGLGALGIGAVALTQTAALYGVVTPWLTGPVRSRLLAGFAAAAVLSVPLVGPLGAGRWDSWAWLGGSIAGTVPVLVRRWRPAGWWVAAGAVGASLVTSAGVAGWTGGAPGAAAAITVWVGLAVAATIGLPVWLWGLLALLAQGREAQARLAATEERLRFARDLHDLLGHSLTVIALKAELAARLAATDPDRAAEQATQAQRLAADALSQTRQAVHGYRAVDLAEQLDATAQVLRSSGVSCTVPPPPATAAVPPELAGQLAAVLREASTNLLRHSRASWCTIEITTDDGQVRMTVTNDGVRAAGPDRHSYGLRGLAERLAGAGGVLRSRVDDGVFVLEASIPAVAP